MVHLRILEILAMNDQQVELGVVHGRLQNNLNELMMLFAAGQNTDDDSSYLLNLIRV
jgi:hypothetical protein